MDLNAKRKTVKLEDKVGENIGDVGFGDDITKSMINERKKLVIWTSLKDRMKRRATERRKSCKTYDKGLSYKTKNS